jgi:hypothetical protein
LATTVLKMKTMIMIDSMRRLMWCGDSGSNFRTNFNS